MSQRKSLHHNIDSKQGCILNLPFKIINQNSQILEAAFPNMSDQPVANWESIIHKNVRASDGEASGNVVAVEGDTIFIESQGDKIHVQIPKSLVAGFNGAEVSLKVPRSELREYASK
jgi:hypothetical protein